MYKKMFHYDQVYIFLFHGFVNNLMTRGACQQKWAKSQKTDSGSAPSLKTWTPNLLWNPVCQQILESESASNVKNAARLQLRHLSGSVPIPDGYRYLKRF